MILYKTIDIIEVKRKIYFSLFLVLRMIILNNI